jgi:hypothetical protein
MQSVHCMLCLYMYVILFMQAFIVGLYVHFMNFVIFFVCSQSVKLGGILKIKKFYSLSPES